MASKALVVTGLVVNALLWSQSRYATPPSTSQSTAWSTLQSTPPDARLGLSSLLARAWTETAAVDDPTFFAEEKTCRPLSFPVEDRCHHVWKACPASETFLSINYLQGYFCAVTPARPFFFGGLLVWLVFLFSFIGITASDFFCPNLSTISSVFGLSDNIAGVTFLAFGNGSPDLFATYSAMRADSGSLAIGELLGAASFIISVVAGTLGIIKPFRVRRGPFLRDIGFFTTAVSLMFISLYDGKLQVWEAALMIVLYIVYVAVVVCGTWWENRGRKSKEREELSRAEYADDDMGSSFMGSERYADDDDVTPQASRHSLAIPGEEARSRSHPLPNRPSITTHMSSSLRRLSQSQYLPGRTSRGSFTSDVHDDRESRSFPDIRHDHSPVLPSFSLLGALEFQSVVNALERESNAAGLGMFETPHGHLRRRSSQKSRSPRPSSGSKVLVTGSQEEERDPWDAALSQPDVLQAQVESTGTQAMPLSPLYGTPVDRSISTPRHSIPSINVSPPHTRDAQDGVRVPLPASDPLFVPGVRSAPALLHHDIGSPMASSAATAVVKEKSRTMEIVSAVLCTLFPTLHNLSSPDKSWLGRIAAVVAAPAVLLLTVTLPVVITSDDDDQSEDGDKQSGVLEGQLVDIRIDVEGVPREGENDGGYADSPNSNHNPFTYQRTAQATAEELERDGESDVSSIMSDIEKEMHGIHFNKWLLCAQSVCGPVFVAAVLFSHYPYAWMILLATFVAGISAGILVFFFAKTGRTTAGRIVRSLMGFVVAMVWIMAIADEVVRVLQTFGYIFGLTDAIVGLTVFAIGNSLADFVANIAVARFAPIMGFSACFGGPMLNMLLGVGISGSIVLRQTGKSYYPIEFSQTLFVSTVGLLVLLVTTMIFVPLNGYWMTRRWGIFLICAYVGIMTTNIVTEIKRER